MGHMEKVGNDTHIYVDPFIISLGFENEVEVFNKLREALPGKPAEALDRVEAAYKAKDKPLLSSEYRNFTGIMLNLSPNINIEITENKVIFPMILTLTAFIVGFLSGC